jgi:hypothetical protein
VSRFSGAALDSLAAIFGIRGGATRTDEIDLTQVSLTAETSKLAAFQQSLLGRQVGFPLGDIHTGSGQRNLFFSPWVDVISLLGTNDVGRFLPFDFWVTNISAQDAGTTITRVNVTAPLPTNRMNNAGVGNLGAPVWKSETKWVGGPTAFTGHFLQLNDANNFWNAFLFPMRLEHVVASTMGLQLNSTASAMGTVLWWVQGMYLPKGMSP